jgi:release factor glutamine methyltransferase
MTTLHSAIRHAAAELRDSVEQPQTDAEFLVAHAIGTSREYVLAHSDAGMQPTEQARLKHLVDRRRAGEPLAYMMGTAWFYGLPFAVSKDVLIPRPETELLVDAALLLMQHRSFRDKKQHIVDVGTGSGAIAIALAKHGPKSARITATDLSPGALAIAKKNAASLSVRDRITFREDNLIDEFLQRLDDHTTPLLFTANLPYVPEARIDAQSHEPRIALAAGVDGLDLYRAFFSLLEGLRAPWRAIIEVDPLIMGGTPPLLRYHFPNRHVVYQNDLHGDTRIALL